MTTHDTRGANLTRKLAKAIEAFQPGDVIIVATPAAETLARWAAARMGKTITVRVQDGDQ